MRLKLRIDHGNLKLNLNRTCATYEIWLQSQCQRVAEFFKDVNSATLRQEFVSLYQYLSAKDNKRTREEVLQAEQRLKSMCTLSAYSMLMQQSGKPFRTLFPNIVKLIQLLTGIPATSATAERSFSCLRRVKTWLRSTMSQQHGYFACKPSCSTTRRHSY